MRTNKKMKTVSILLVTAMLLSAVMSFGTVFAANLLSVNNPGGYPWHNGTQNVQPDQNGIMSVNSTGIFMGTGPSAIQMLPNSMYDLDLRYSLRIRDFSTDDKVYISVQNSAPSAATLASNNYAVTVTDGSKVSLIKNFSSTQTVLAEAAFTAGFNLTDGLFHTISFVVTNQSAGTVKIEVRFDAITRLSYTDTAALSGNGGFRLETSGCALDIAAESYDGDRITNNSPASFTWYNNSFQPVSPVSGVYSLTSSGSTPVAMTPIQGSAPLKLNNDITHNYKFRLKNFTNTSSAYVTFKDKAPEQEAASRSGLYALYFDGSRNLVLLTKNCNPILDPANMPNLMPNTYTVLSSLSLADDKFHSMSISYTTLGQAVTVRISFDGTERLSYTDTSPYEGPGGIRVGVANATISLAASDYIPSEIEIPGNIAKITNPHVTKWLSSGGSFPNNVYQPENHILSVLQSSGSWHSFEAVNTDANNMPISSKVFPLEFDISVKVKLSGFTTSSTSYLSFRDSAPNSDVWVGEKYGIFFEGDKMMLKKNNQTIATTPNTTIRWFDSSFKPADGNYHVVRLSVFNVSGGLQIVVSVDGTQILHYLDTEPLTGTGMRAGVLNTDMYLAPASESLLNLSANTLSMYAKDSTQLTAGITPAGTGGTISWESGNTSVVTVSSNGLVTAHTAGTAVITAKSSIDSNVFDTCVITVANPYSFSMVDLNTKLFFAPDASQPVTVGQCISNLGLNTGVTAVFKDTNDNTLTSNAILGTGAVLTISYGSVTETLTVTVSGDLNGDGIKTISDIIVLKNCLLGKGTLSGAYETAANVTGSGSLSINDLLVLKSAVLANQN